MEEKPEHEIILSSPPIEESARADNPTAKAQGRARKHLPFISERLPEYPNLNSLSAGKTATYFDSHGRPRVATAKEIAPPQDFPYSPLMRFAVYLTYGLLRGEVIWPLNIQHNVVLYYLIGKRFRFVLIDALVPVILLLAFVADFGFSLLPGIIPFTNFSSTVLSVLPVALGLMLANFFGTKRFLAQLTDRQLGEELELTRITVPEMSYGILMRMLAPVALGVVLFCIGEWVVFAFLFSVQELEPGLFPSGMGSGLNEVMIPFYLAVPLKGLVYLSSGLVGFIVAYDEGIIRGRWEAVHLNEKPSQLRALPVTFLISAALIVAGFSLFAVFCSLLGLVLVFAGVNLLLKCTNLCVNTLALLNTCTSAGDFLRRINRP